MHHDLPSLALGRSMSRNRMRHRGGNVVVSVKPWSYSAHAYYNRGATWTGWVKMSNSACSSKFIARAGYESEAMAMAYADRWCKKLNERCPFANAK